MVSVGFYSWMNCDNRIGLEDTNRIGFGTTIIIIEFIQTNKKVLLKTVL